MITRLCVCGEEFQTYPSRIAEGRGVYCSRACSDRYTLIKKGEHRSRATELKKGQKPHNFRGESFTQSRPQSGTYRYIYVPDHPNATTRGYVREHRLVMEEKLGRYLGADEVIDHINMNTLDNRPENLRLMKKRDHDRMNTWFNIHRRWNLKPPKHLR